MSGAPSTTLAQLAHQAQEAMRRRDFVHALDLLTEAERSAPEDASIKMQKAVALRTTGDLKGSLDTLNAALALDPYNFMALLAKGALVERLAGERAAAEIYRNALKIAPAEPAPGLAAPLARARDVLSRTTQELEAHLRKETLAAEVECSPSAQARFDESLRIFSGAAKAYHSEALLLHYPRLPAIPFYDRALFPWLPKLEAQTDMIRGELEAALAGQRGFAPYINYPPDAPVNQWEELNHSPRWSAFFLWRDGERQDEACAACPRTAALMDALPLARQPGFAPTVVFSVLAPHTHIPPHTGSTNTRLLVHLPLILPGPARFRVGNEVREWRMGEAWVFDDTIEHEAWNDADEQRVIMIIDIWNPYLEPGEQALVSAMLAASREFMSRQEPKP